MRRGSLLLAMSALVAAATATASSQVFRGGVDVISVDVTVLDRDGTPIENLGPGDFTVKIDGQTRRVVSAALQKPGSAPPRAAVAPERFFSTNLTPVASRKVMFAVDQLQVAPGAHNRLYLETKREKMGHLLHDDDVPPEPRRDDDQEPPRLRVEGE